MVIDILKASARFDKFASDTNQSFKICEFSDPRFAEIYMCIKPNDVWTHSG